MPELALLLQHIGIVDIGAVSVGHALDPRSGLRSNSQCRPRAVVYPASRACDLCVALAVQLAEKGESAEQVCLREARRIVASVQEYTPLHGSPGTLPLCRCGFFAVWRLGVRFSHSVRCDDSMRCVTGVLFLWCVASGLRRQGEVPAMQELVFSEYLEALGYAAVSRWSAEVEVTDTEKTRRALQVCVCNYIGCTSTRTHPL